MTVAFRNFELPARRLMWPLRARTASAADRRSAAAPASSCYTFAAMNSDGGPIYRAQTEAGATPLKTARASLSDPIAQAIVFILLVSLLFVAFPSADLAFSALFSHVGHPFPLRQLTAFAAFAQIA